MFILNNNPIVSCWNNELNFPSTHTMKCISHLEHDNYFLMRDVFIKNKDKKEEILLYNQSIDDCHFMSNFFNLKNWYIQTSVAG